MLLVFIGLLCIVGAFSNGFHWIPFVIGILLIIMGLCTVVGDDNCDDWGCD